MRAHACFRVGGRLRPGRASRGRSTILELECASPKGGSCGVTQRVAQGHVHEGADRAHLASARATESAAPSHDLEVVGPATAPGVAWFREPTAERRPPTISRHTILSLQRSVGNAVVSGAFRALPQRSARGETVQRDGEAQPTASVPVKSVSINASKVSVPPSSGSSIKATTTPGTATGVKWTVEAGSVAPSNVTIDATTGVITVAAGQQGGTVTIKATSDDSAWATMDLRLVEKPVAVASTTASSAGGSVYGGQFTHTFSSPSGQASGLQGENINEKFDSLKAASGFGTFTLAANPSGSAGWDLTSAGAMAGPDNVDIEKAMIDVGKFVKSASNPAPANTLPVGFSMVQHMHAKSFPAGTLDASPFTDVNHVRTLTDKETFTVTAGLNHTDDPYTGPSAYTNIKASATSVNASPPKPKVPATGSWTRNKVTVTADVIPGKGTKVFSLVGSKLGCEIDASSGEVLIGDQAGTIKVRVSAGAGGANFDEVSITITPAPAPTPKPTSETGD